jgi:predicted CopG family antitoxin
MIAVSEDTYNKLAEIKFRKKHRSFNDAIVLLLLYATPEISTLVEKNATEQDLPEIPRYD